jgi:hypothetical protein
MVLKSFEAKRVEAQYAETHAVSSTWEVQQRSSEAETDFRRR